MNKEPCMKVACPFPTETMVRGTLWMCMDCFVIYVRTGLGFAPIVWEQSSGKPTKGRIYA